MVLWGRKDKDRHENGNSKKSEESSMSSYKRGSVLSVLVLILIISMASAASAAVATSVGSGVDPATDGNLVVFARTDGKEIHLFDLVTKKDFKIKTTLSCYPDIDFSTNTLVWCENGKAPRLSVYNMKTAKTINIAPVEAWTDAAISSGRIVWSRQGNVNLYDVATKTQSVVAAGYNPDISGDNIAYEVGDGSVAIYNLASKTTKVVPHEGDLTDLDISGDYVVFTDHMGNLAQYVIATNEYKVINVNNIPGHSDEGVLYDYARCGPVVVYDRPRDDSMGLAGVYVYDDGRSTLGLLNYTGDNTGARVDISGDPAHGFNVVWGFVAKADGAKKVNGGIYTATFAPTDTGNLVQTGHLHVDTGRDGTSIAVYQKDRFIVANSGRTLEADIPVGEYMLIISGMGDPATTSQTFTLTEAGVYMNYPIN